MTGKATTKRSVKWRITHNLKKIGAVIPAASPRGKLYELLVLSEVLLTLKRNGIAVHTRGSTLGLKTGGGPINRAYAYFELIGRNGEEFQVFTDVYVRTLGDSFGGISDRSAYHEVDILVCDEGASGSPTPDEIVLAVECKAYGKFKKTSVREVLGLRRETALLRRGWPSRLSAARGRAGSSHSHNGSELWFFFMDPEGNRYRRSPYKFGIKFFHLEGDP